MPNQLCTAVHVLCALCDCGGYIFIAVWSYSLLIHHYACQTHRMPGNKSTAHWTKREGKRCISRVRSKLPCNLSRGIREKSKNQVSLNKIQWSAIHWEANKTPLMNRKGQYMATITTTINATTSKRTQVKHERARTRNEQDDEAHKLMSECRCALLRVWVQIGLGE